MNLSLQSLIKYAKINDPSTELIEGPRSVLQFMARTKLHIEQKDTRTRDMTDREKTENAISKGTLS